MARLGTCLDLRALTVRDSSKADGGLTSDLQRIVHIENKESCCRSRSGDQRGVTRHPTGTLPAKKPAVFSTRYFSCGILDFCTSDLRLRRRMLTRLLEVRLPPMVAHVIRFVLQNLPALL